MSLHPELRRRPDFNRDPAAGSWYHSFELPDGRRIDGYIGLDALRERYARFPLPANLAGRRVLDVGAWDGWFSFEAERRGARVTAVDCVEIPNFRRMHRMLGSAVDYRVLDVIDLAEALPPFDYVFFLGVLYHVRHPLLALENVCRVTREIAVVDSFVTDGSSWRERAAEIPAIEFYERDELGGQIDNWFGPSVGSLLAMCRAAGFARAELLHAHGFHASVACFRRWEPPPADASGPAPDLEAVSNARDFGINFSGKRDEYLICWFRSGRSRILCEDLCLEAAGFGTPALYVERQKDRLWLANFLLPPGLPSGWIDVRLRFSDSAFSNECKIAVGLPATVQDLALRSACDAFTWTENRVQTRDRTFLSFWVKGLPENCDRGNLRAWLGDWRLGIDWIGLANEDDGYRQVNALVPQEVPKGNYALRIEVADRRICSATPVTVE